MFHYNTVTGIGFLGYFLAFYIYKAYRATNNKHLSLEWKEGDIQTASSLPELIIKLFSILLCDYICTDFTPMALFGTKQLTMIPDFLIKKLLNICVICSIVHS